MDYCYRFPVVKGLQAKKEYYIAMVPLKMLGKLFPNEDEYVPPECRAQRRINESRIPEIKKYIIDNRESYVFSALAASIDGEHRFIPSNCNNVGILEVSMEAKFLINDGQHRKASILSALNESSDLGDETISVVFYGDEGLARSQQMFTDLNKHAVKTSNSIAELYDSRDEIAVVTRNTISKIPFLNEYVDKERDILGKFSSALFTLNTFYNASKKIIKRGSPTVQFESFLYAFWTNIVNHMIPWMDLVDRQISKRDLREQYVATQAIIIQAFGRVGAYIWENDCDCNSCNFKALETINWKRNAEEWKQRVTRNDGRIINSERASLLASNYIKTVMGLPLSEEERAMEEHRGEFE